MVEPAELHRLYPPARHEAVHDPDDGAPRIAALEARLEAANDAIRVRDDMIAAHRSEIVDLRQQRDRAQEALTAAQERIAALLTDQRAKTETASNLPASAAPRQPWWHWRRR